ncbi:MAG: LuxR C-terminal-related transcriptional regulator, partial [Lentilitoribacter sp.]
MRHQKIIELSEKARTAESSDAFWKICTKALGASGVTGVGYGILPYSVDAKINGFSKAGFFRHTYSDDWASAFTEKPVIDSDLSVELIVGGTLEILWNDDEIYEQASKSQKLQNDLENDIGMRFGASIALGRNAFGQAISGIGLCVGEIKSDKTFSTYWQEHQEQLRQMCHILDEGLRSHHAQLLVRLTPRERECLTYLAVGLRPAEICWRLKISEKTFEAHIR